MNGNLKRTEELMMRYGNAVVVSSWFGDERFRIPADGVTQPWDLDGLVAKLLEVDRPILLAAGPCANIIALRYWQRQKPDKRQTILDVGSALDVLHGKYSRACHTLKADHQCSWQGIEYLPAPRSSRHRTPDSPAPSPTHRVGSQGNATAAQPLPTRTRERPSQVKKVGTPASRARGPIVEREPVVRNRSTGAQSIRQVEAGATKSGGRMVITTRSRPAATQHVGRTMIRSTRAAAPTPIASSAPPCNLQAAAIVVTKRPWLASFVAQNLGWQSKKPAFVLVASSAADYDIAPIKAALPDATVDFVPVSADLNLGELRNLAMSIAAEQVDDDFLLCTIDDDDGYGQDYLEGLLDAFQRHPAALIIGRASFQGIEVAEAPTIPPPPNPRVRKGLVPGVAGSTISVPAKLWRDRGEFRYPPIAIGEDVALQAIARRERGIVSANFGDYAPLRWRNAEHGHTSPNNHGAVPLVLVQDGGHHKIHARGR
jgi:hypothetical protein